MSRGGGQVEDFLRCASIEIFAPDRLMRPLRQFFPALRLNTPAALFKGFQMRAAHVEIQVRGILPRIMKMCVPEGIVAMGIGD